MENQKIYIKCSGCYCLRGEDEYEIYKGIRRKTCLKCKEKRKKAKEHQKKYRENNREQIAEYQKKYLQNNREKLNEYRKQWRTDYKCEHNKRKGECRECNPLLCLVKLQRVSIKRMLKISDLNKTKSTIEYLGCSPEYFKEYLQNKMTDEMTFENINLDHIKPVSRFNLDYPDEFLDCCHYTNLQPLLAKDNLEKSNKWTEKDEIYWKENIRGKETKDIYYSWK